MSKMPLQSWSKDQLIAEVARLRKRKKYGLVWEDKPENVVEQCKTELPVLKEVKNKAIAKDKNGPVNILIEGDNFHALSVLNYTHENKIDLIYIDPPYNTGSEGFVYNDKIVNREDSYRHSMWLSFIGKRLRHAKKLLKKTGFIFISIDDNEQAPLKVLCDEIFGEKNFVSCITVYSNPRGRQSTAYVALTHEYLLVYAKSDKAQLAGEKLSSEKIKEYRNKDKGGVYREIGLRLRGGRATAKESPTLHFPIYVNPKNQKISLDKTREYIEIIPKFEDGTLGTWRWSKKKIIEDMDFLLARPVRIKGGERWDIFEKDYLTDDKTLKVKSVWFDREINYDNAAEEIKDLFHKKAFNYAKPTALIKKIINIATNSDSIILDFFAGSGTTGHAVIELNKEDGGNRRFILCTNNENNIATEVCYPRVAKAIEGYKDAKGKMVEGVNSNFKYFRTAFVGAEPNDKNKEALTKQATEMLCMREDTFDLVKETDAVKIFKNSKQYTGIVFDEDAISALKKDIAKIGGVWSVFIFSLGDDIFEDEFGDMKQKITIAPIPEAILRVYRRLFKP